MKKFFNNPQIPYFVKVVEKVDTTRDHSIFLDYFFYHHSTSMSIIVLLKNPAVVCKRLLPKAT